MARLTQEQINVDLFDEVKRLHAENAELREVLTQARLAMIGSRDYAKGRGLTHAGLDRCIEMADAVLK